MMTSHSGLRLPAASRSGRAGRDGAGPGFPLLDEPAEAVGDELDELLLLEEEGILAAGRARSRSSRLRRRRRRRPARAERDALDPGRLDETGRTGRRRSRNVIRTRQRSGILPARGDEVDEALKDLVGGQAGRLDDARRCPGGSRSSLTRSRRGPPGNRTAKPFGSCSMTMDHRCPGRRAAWKSCRSAGGRRVRSRSQTNPAAQVAGFGDARDGDHVGRVAHVDASSRGPARRRP